MSMRKVHIVLLAATLLIFGCTGQESMEKGTLSVTTSFKNGGEIPKKYTCDGMNINPPLVIGGVSEKAKSLVIIADDPDAPMGTFTHWIAWNIPVTDRIPEGVPKAGAVNKPVRMVQGINDFGKIGYDGPCPPRGEKHRYFFRIYALDTMLDLEPGAGRKELELAMKGHVIQYGEIMGIYRRS